MSPKRARLLEGWSLVAWAAGAAVVIAGAAFAREGVADAGLRAGIRGTAMLAAAIFVAVFVASSWNALRPSAASKYLLRNRRYLGVSVAASQAVHAALFSTLAARAERAVRAPRNRHAARSQDARAGLPHRGAATSRSRHRRRKGG